MRSIVYLVSATLLFATTCTAAERHHKKQRHTPAPVTAPIPAAERPEPVPLPPQQQQEPVAIVEPNDLTIFEFEQLLQDYGKKRLAQADQSVTLDPAMLYKPASAKEITDAYAAQVTCPEPTRSNKALWFFIGFLDVVLLGTILFLVRRRAN